MVGKGKGVLEEEIVCVVDRSVLPARESSEKE